MAAMALDEEAAAAVQALLNHQLGRPGLDGGPVPESVARSAAIVLADQARAAIGRGLTGSGVAESWLEPTTTDEHGREGDGAQAGAGRPYRVTVVERVAPERRTGKKATMWVRLSPDVDEAEWVDSADATFECHIGDAFTAGVKVEIGGGMNPRVDRDIVELVVTGEVGDTVAIGPRVANFTLAGVVRA